MVMHDAEKQGEGKRPTIVAIEGLDGCGKSTTVRLLADELGAVVIRNPPERLAQERLVADNWDPPERRAWYLQANRLAMEDALAVGDRPVVLDRSIASTLCFGAAEHGGIATRSDLPPGFALPDLIVLLDLPEPVRRARHAGRRGDVTVEEERLAVDHAFRQRVLAGYRGLCSVVIDADKAPEEVVAAIMAVIQRWNVRHRAVLLST
jgi:thymidylate kinase